MIFKSLQKFGVNLFFYFLKGARVDAALKWNGRSRSPTGRTYPKPGAVPVMENGLAIAYNADDLIREWRITSKGELVIKNNSRNHAYNLQLLNAEDIFSTYTPLPTLSSLGPNESIELPIEFIQMCYAPSGLDADKVPDIPKEKENFILKIRYENEAGTKFLTKFAVSYSTIYNEYTY
jgi:hypothetical protein